MVGPVRPIEVVLNPMVVNPAVRFYTPLPAVTQRIDGTFEGGGTLGAAYCGSLLALARNGI